MATVHIPAPMRGLTGGKSEVSVPGASLGEVVDALEVAYPGLKPRLVEGDRIRPGLAMFVGGVQAPSRLSQHLSESAEIYFAPAIAGG
jgi:molybdopterin synthase sulfur carrier subunit